jgi:hypothetical protein
VIEEVCDRSAAWSALRLEPEISFNVAPRQLRQPGFADIVSHAIERRGLDPSHFLAEVTESAALADEGMATARQPSGGRAAHRRSTTSALTALVVRAAARAGVRHPQDRPLVPHRGARRSEGQARGQRDPGADVRCRHDRDRRGRRDRAAAPLPGRRGCAYAQGYYLARPMPAEDATELLLAQSALRRRSPQRVHSSN